jgi:hypothetical protein
VLDFCSGHGDIYFLILYSVGRHLPKNETDSETINKRGTIKEKSDRNMERKRKYLTNGEKLKAEENRQKGANKRAETKYTKRKKTRRERNMKRERKACFKFNCCSHELSIHFTYGTIHAVTVSSTNSATRWICQQLSLVIFVTIYLEGKDKAVPVLKQLSTTLLK